MNLLRYFAGLSSGKVTLWCYLIWYLSTVAQYFDPSPTLWLNSVGISLVVGIALILSVRAKDAPAMDRWQTFRLFFMPFAVSSFSALIKGHGFFLVFPPSLAQIIAQLGACAVFVLLVYAVKQLARKHAA